MSYVNKTLIKHKNVEEQKKNRKKVKKKNYHTHLLHDTILIFMPINFYDMFEYKSLISRDLSYIKNNENSGIYI